MSGSTRSRYVALGGGLDVVSPPLAMPPGRALALVNFEPWYNGGYRRIKGYERYDGRPRPSEALFYGFNVSTVAGLSVGTTVTGATSGCTGVVCGIWDDDGTYGADAIAVTKIGGTGFFTNGETINGGGARTVSSVPAIYTAPNDTLKDAWLLAAQDEYRDDIGEVPGQEWVRGAWRRKSTMYAVRRDVAASTYSLYRSSTSGWTTSGITFTRTMYFTGGGGGTAQALPAEGTTINGATSGATGVVHRVITHSGATGTNDAVGYLALTSVSGTFQDGENLRVVTTVFAVASSVATLFAMTTAATRYRWLNHNFKATSTTLRTYGVSTSGPAFEIDENHVVTPILLPETAVTNQPATNTPHLLAVHRNYLFLAFPGGRVVHSVVGEPLVFNGFLGAAEFGLGAEVTGLVSSAGSVLIINTERFSKGLYGNGTSDWEMKLLSEKMGAIIDTAGELDTVYTLNELGISALSRSDTFGDFQGAVVSSLVAPLIPSRNYYETAYWGDPNHHVTYASGASVVKATNQYRLYLNATTSGIGGWCLIMHVPSPGVAQERGTGSPLGVEFGLAKYPITTTNHGSAADDDAIDSGIERYFFTADYQNTPHDGYVYEDQAGNSFDGEPIESYIQLPHWHMGSPGFRKFWRRAELELSTPMPVTLYFVQDVEYGAQDTSSAIDASLSQVALSPRDVPLGLARWDPAGWDAIIWAGGGPTMSVAHADLGGSSEATSLFLYHSSAIVEPFIVQGVTVHYDPRRRQR